MHGTVASFKSIDIPIYIEGDFQGELIGASALGATVDSDITITGDLLGSIVVQLSG